MNDTDTPRTDPCGWLKSYHSSGILVTLPVLGKTPAEWYAAVDAIVAAGFTLASPGLEAGELRKDIGWVVRTTTEGRSGPADCLHLYAAEESWTHPFLVKYLNTAQDRADFEYASKMRLDTIHEYVGEGRLERGKSPKTDGLIIKAPHPFAVIYGPNPNYNDAEAQATKAKGQVYKIPKKVFIRWADQKPAVAEKPATPAPAQAAQKTKPASPVAAPDDIEIRWLAWLEKRPTLEKLNEAWAKNLPPGAKQHFENYAEREGWVLDTEGRTFVSMF